MTVDRPIVNQQRSLLLLLTLVVVVGLGACQSAPVKAATNILRPSSPTAAVAWNPDDAGLNTALLQRRVWESELAEPIAALPASEATASEPVSYVNLRGPSDIRDWRLCESRTGGAFVLGPRGAATAPDFDACLRGLGYLPEPEALQLLG